MLEKVDRGLAAITNFCGVLAAVLFIAMLINVSYDVSARYAFDSVSVGMQELEWHLFSAAFLLAIPYAVQTDGHVRVDVFYERASERAKALINLIGSIVFLLPFALLILWYGVGFTENAWSIGETSGDPGGLTHRWIIKSMIPISAGLLALSGVGMITHAVLVMSGRAHYSPPPAAEKMSTKSGALL
ncbi:MAG: C4-dicarboxylate ABC transporter [unclassified Hahellaceae]|nr:C4-dicarboxylate ABC transporter [Hahellaceae bacterium]|tara:strand:+ start:73575 stop:74135 length:561 start_codon:yes stop_codon:yes gene_type:complete